MRLFPPLRACRQPLSPVTVFRRWIATVTLLLAAALSWAAPLQAKEGRAGGALVETVKVSGGLSVGRYEVTQAQYEAVMGKNPSNFQGPRKPVENVSWEDAMKFCKRLTDSEHQAGRLAAKLRYTLPTEKQWETFAAGTSLSDAVTSAKRRRDSTADVGSLHANRFGLYDVRGNVWEWCLNPDEPGSDARVIRGGAFANSEPEKLEISYRFALTPLFKIPGVGFRVVIVPM